MVSVSTRKLVQVFGIFLVIVAVTSGFDLKFKNCGSHARIKSLNVSHCNSNPCVLHHKINYNARMTFTAYENTTSLTNKVWVLVNRRKYPYTSIETNACKGVECPIIKGEHKIMEALLVVPKYVPRLSVATSGCSLAYESGLQSVESNIGYYAYPDYLSYYSYLLYTALSRLNSFIPNTHSNC